MLLLKQQLIFASKEDSKNIESFLISCIHKCENYSIQSLRVSVFKYSHF